MREIEFTIDLDGTTSMDLKGFEGRGCSEITDQFVKALGKRVKTSKKTEYYKVDAKQKQKINRL